MDEDGFKPQEISVNQNSVIEFKNNGKQQHWPASDPHPTHDLYPEFDPQKPINPGESWKFKVQKVGKWNFHDHLNHDRKGTLIVNGNEGVIKNPSVKSSLGWDYQNLQNISDEKGAEEAWKNLSNNYKQGKMQTNPHDLAHFVGGLIFDKKGLKGIGICTTDFAFGCYHGLLDKAFLNGLGQLNEAESSCLSVGPIGSGPFASCIHGIGHGVASFFKTTDLKSALSTCDKLSDGQTFCHDGVFMEFERSAPASFYKTDDPLYPCDSIDQRYLSTCGRNQPQAMSNRLGIPFELIPGICLSLKDSEFQSSCFDSLGFIVANNSEGDPDTIIKECGGIMQEQARYQCLVAAGGELIFQNMPNGQQSSKKICDFLTLDFRGKCNERMQQITADYQRK